MPSSFRSLNTNPDTLARVAANCEENNKLHCLQYRGKKLAGFRVNGELMICLPQAYQIFLSEVIGGMHTVYTKLKRLGIQPLICNVEQVRLLRGVGAIQSGVNRCKLIRPEEFDKLYQDCTDLNSRPGRPAKRVSPIVRDDCRPQKRPQLDNFALNLWTNPSGYQPVIRHQPIVAFNPTRMMAPPPQPSSIARLPNIGSSFTRNIYRPNDSFMIDRLIGDGPGNQSEKYGDIDSKLKAIIDEITALSESISLIDTHLRIKVHKDLEAIKLDCGRSRTTMRRILMEMELRKAGIRSRLRIHPINRM